MFFITVTNCSLTVTEVGEVIGQRSHHTTRSFYLIPQPNIYFFHEMHKKNQLVNI